MNKKKRNNFDDKRLKENLEYLKLNSFIEEYEDIAGFAQKENWGYDKYLLELSNGEATARKERMVQRRIRTAKFPVTKTLDEFDWTWPKKINRLQTEALFRLRFVEKNTNIIFMGGVGLGKSHLSCALGYQACMKGLSVLFASAIDIINSLNAAQNAGRFKQQINKYLKPKILVIDELGYLPVDRKGADTLFQVICKRYEKAPVILTTNKPFKKWPEIFANDSTLTSAVLDRLLHHAEVITIEGKSYRMKDNDNS